MKISHGKSRMVITVPALGIAIKIAKCQPILAITQVMKYYRNHGWQGAYLAVQLSIDSSQGGPKKLILKGLRDNWQECWFYWHKRHPFCQPTYFSAIGIINIQKLGDDYYVPGKEFWEFMKRNIGPDVQRDAHHFCSSDNFCLTPAGDLRIMDYGSQITRWIVKEYGHRIIKADPPPQCHKELAQEAALTYD